ncbi:MAG TPA: hypothetical protein VMP11_07910 [Verrucomicrobiae bacterium]|nr:hypothetical protein [Verrucomicrobiae bacterium]
MDEIIEAPKQTSARQMKSNRENCRKSTGPKTVTGKANSRLNAVKHGMLSSQVVVRGLQVRERTKDFQEMRDRLWEELAPVGTMEEMLVDRIVTAHWRMRRALTAEAGEIVLSVDGGHWKREKRGPERFRGLLGGLRDPIMEMAQSASGLSYLMSRFGDLRRDIEKAGEVTEAAMDRFRSRFGELENSFTREMAELRKELMENPAGLSAEALKDEIRERVLGRIQGRLNLYELLIRDCEKREENEEDARQSAEVLPSPEALDKILRYEGTMERQLYRAMNQLERLQRRRNGEVVPPPITMDVSR